MSFEFKASWSARSSMAALAAPSQSILPDLVPDANAVDDEDDLEDDDDDDDDEQPPMRKGVSRLGISKKAWTPAEDEILTAVVEKQGPSRWSTIAHHLPGRMGKQCRERCARSTVQRALQRRALAPAILRAARSNSKSHLAP